MCELSIHHPSHHAFYDFIVTTNHQFVVLLCKFIFKAVVYKYFCVNYFYSCIVYCFISLPVDSRKCIMNCHKVKFQWNFYVVSKSDLRCLKFYIRVKVHEAHQRNKMELQPSIYKCKAWQCLARSHVVLHHNYYLQQTNNVKFFGIASSVCNKVEFGNWRISPSSSIFCFLMKKKMYFVLLSIKPQPCCKRPHMDQILFRYNIF